MNYLDRSAHHGPEGVRTTRLASVLIIGLLVCGGCRQVTVRHTTRRIPPEIAYPPPETAPTKPTPPPKPGPKPRAPEKGDYTVRKGDTLWSISHHFGLASWRELLEANPGIRNPKQLIPGTRITIPGRPSRSRAKPDSTHVRGPLLPTPRVPAGPKERRFVWPVRGRLLCRYGRPEPGSQNVICRGVLIGVRPETPVRAAKSGVAFVMDSVPGLGRTVAVDHGDGTVTTYAHNGRFAVGYGEYVRQGETIAYAGHTGRARSTQVFFRIDVNGQPVDPLRYLPR